MSRNRKSWLEKEIGSYEYRLARALLPEVSEVQDEEISTLLNEDEVFVDEDMGLSIQRGKIYIYEGNRITYLGFQEQRNGIIQLKIRYLDMHGKEDWVPSWFISRFQPLPEGDEANFSEKSARGLMHKIRNFLIEQDGD